MQRLLVQLFLFLSVSISARATEIAVLDFDSFGMTHDEASLVSQGFRDGFLEDGRFFPLEGYDISDRLGSGFEAELSQARSLVAEARTSLNSGRASQAIQLLEEAEQLHRTAGSHIARRAQLSDVYFFLGQAQLRTSQGRDAHESFITMLQTYPGYLESRAGSVSSAVRTAIERAKGDRAQRSREIRDSAEVQAIASRMRVSSVVVGVADGNGQVQVRLIQNGRIQGEITRQLQEMPPFPGDPIYLEMIKELTLNMGAVGSSGGFQAPPGFDSSPAPSGGSSGFSTPDFDEAPPLAAGQDPAQEDTPLPDAIGRERTQRWKFWKNWDVGSKEPVTGRINVGGRSHLPVTQRWWFWGATGAVVAGGGVAAAIVLSGAEGNSENGDGPSYTIRIDTE